jgi:hypothetical protein
VVKHAFGAQNEDELSLEIGDIVTVLSAPAGGWWQGSLLGNTAVSGWFPCNHVEMSETLVVPDRTVDSPAANTTVDSETDENELAANGGNDVTEAAIFVCLGF